MVVLDQHQTLIMAVVVVAVLTLPELMEQTLRNTQAVMEVTVLYLLLVELLLLAQVVALLVHTKEALEQQELAEVVAPVLLLDHLEQAEMELQIPAVEAVVQAVYQVQVIQADQAVLGL